MTKTRENDLYNNSILSPTYNSASYYFKNKDEVKKGLHDKSLPLGRYGRYNNPTWNMVENRLTKLNNSEDTLLFSSGMAAHFTTFVALLEKGDHVILPSESYRQTRNLFLKILPKFGINVHELSIKESNTFLRNVKSLKESLGNKLKLIHLEMPSSPHMYLIDLKKVREIISSEVILTMDSSFSPPPNFFALNWGVDIALFSGTKYLNGHGDIMIGLATGKSKYIDKISWYRDTTGAIVDGNTAQMLNRSLHTLHLRINHINEMGLKVAKFLDSHEKVSKVLYTGLASHPHYKLAKQYLHGHGGVITFQLPLSESETAKFVDNLKLPFMASNFGAPQTLVEQSTYFTYFEYDDDGLENIGVTRGTVRLALGYIDNIEDIIQDLDQALNKI